LYAISLPACGPDGGAPSTPPPPAKREELADEAALAELSDPMRTPLLGDGSYRQQSSYDRESAPPPVDFVARGNRDMNHFVCKSADADVSTAQLIEPVYDEPNCAEAYAKGVVLARFEGSGRLARLWMTASSLRKGLVADNEIFRVWVDDNPVPVVEEPLAAVIDGSAGEMFAPPFGFGPGDHIVWHYPVVFAKKLVIALDGLGPLEYYYHQESVVLDATPSARVAAAARLPGRDAAIAALSAADNGSTFGEPLLPDAAVTLAPSETKTIADLSGPATIQAFTVRIAESALSALADVAIDVTWDNAAMPAISMSFSDLFATWLQAPSGKSLGLAGEKIGSDIALSLRLPMPFSNHAKMVVTNNAIAPVEFSVSIRGQTKIPDAPFGRLMALRNETGAPAPGKSHPLGTWAGKGRWAGTCMALEGHGIGDGGVFDEPFNFLEGDELGILDGVPAVRGTGTEDYFDSAFYYEAGPRATAFSQWWGAEVLAPNAAVSCCRFHILGDGIDFAKSADLSLEIGPGIPETLNRFRSVTFVYQ